MRERGSWTESEGQGVFWFWSTVRSRHGRFWAGLLLSADSRCFFKSVYLYMHARACVCLCVWTIREHTCGVFSAAVGAVSEVVEAGDRCNRLYTRSGRSHVVGTVPFQN